MQGGGQYITYGLYKDAARSQRWGQAGGEPVTGTGAGVSVPQPLTVYGRVPAQAVPAPGNYADTVTITLTY